MDGRPERSGKARLARVADPLLVQAPSPEDRNSALFLRAPREELEGLYKRGELAKLAEYGGLVHGGLSNPPSDGLFAAHALFRGLCRPFKERRNDDEIFAYVCDAPTTYVFESGLGSDVVPGPARHGEVFLVFADLSPRRGDDGKQYDGRVLYWEWHEAESVDGVWLPKPDGEPDTRFSERFWVT